MSIIKELLKNKPKDKTVFSTTEIGQLLNIDTEKLYSALKYTVKKGDIIRISRGLYSLDKNYSRIEFANKLRTPSYISLYTILLKYGVIFQYYSSIYIISNRSQEIVIDGQKYIYRKIRDNILLNSNGLENINSTLVATLERALCDKIYLDKHEYFDNLRSVNWKYMSELNTKIYKDKNIENFISTNKS